MKTNECVIPHHGIQTVAELEEEYRKLSKPYLLALAIVSLVCVVGLVVALFIHGLFWQNATVTVFFCLGALSGMFLVARLPMPSQYDFVGTKEMVSIGEKLKPYPELCDQFCRIIGVRPVLTKAEYTHFASAIADKEADKADELAIEAWAKMQNDLCRHSEAKG